MRVGRALAGDPRVDRARHVVRAGRAAGGLSTEGVAHVRRTFERLGIETVEGDRVTRLKRGRAWLGDERTVDFDLCVWAAGFRPPPLAREAGIATNATGHNRHRPALRAVSHPDILAIATRRTLWPTRAARAA